MIGILAEKPSQARNFAKALGGISGTYNGESYMIVAARGHLYEFVKPEMQVPAAKKDEYYSWDLAKLPWNENDFAWKRTKKKDAASTIKAIVDAFKKCDEVCVATDDDPTGEGQLLAFEILIENKIHKDKFSRMYFVDESVSEVQKAFKNRKVIPNLHTDPDYVKALYRTKWDFLSMQFTRIATKCGDGQAVLRQGRLKSAMVSLVGAQLDAVNGYKKIPFYGNRFRDENGNMFISPDEPVYATKDEVPQTYTQSKVIVDSKTKKSTAPSKLIDLASLSAQLSSKGIKATTVLATYQKMYEAQVVSYPRTEDKYITPEQFNDLLPKVDAIAKLVGVDVGLLTHRTPRKTHVKTGCAHGANRPGLNVPTSLSGLKQYGTGAEEIYVILAKNYLAMLAEDYEYEQQKGHVEKYPSFTGTANVPLKQGWHMVSYDADDDADVSGSALGTMADPYIHEGFPPKPQTPTMKWLMKQLERYDVGTGATRTNIYAEVTRERDANGNKVKYPLLSDKKGKISMTRFGSMSYMLLPNTNIGDLSMTESLVADMRLISEGKKDFDKCLADVQRLVREDIETMKKNGVTMRKELGVMEQKFETKEKYTGTWNGKEVSFTRTWGGHRFTDAECEALCNGDEIEVFGLKSKAGKEYGITGRLAEQEYNKNKFVGFERTGFANKAGVPDSWCKHDFTAKEKESLENGGTVHIDGAISKKGNVFSCDVVYGEREDGTKGIIPQFN